MFNFNTAYVPNSIVAAFEGFNTDGSPLGIYILRAAPGFSFNDTFVVQTSCLLVLIDEPSVYKVDDVIESGGSIPFLFAFSSDPLSLYDYSYSPCIVPVLSLDYAAEWIVHALNRNDPHIDLNEAFYKYKSYISRNGCKVYLESVKQFATYTSKDPVYNGYCVTKNIEEYYCSWDSNGVELSGNKAFDIVHYGEQY